MVYGAQQWRNLMRMDSDELAAAYECIALIKTAENEAAKEAVKAPRTNPDEV